MESVKILGVKVDNVNMGQSINIVEDWLKGNGKHYIVTPNPEFILASQQDAEFRKVLNNSDLSIPDGSRLGWASRMVAEKNFLKKILLFPFFLFPANTVIQFNTVAGVDLMEALCREAADKGYTTGFLGGQNTVARTTADCLQKKYPKLKVVFASDGPRVDENGESAGQQISKSADQGIADSPILRLADTPVDILFVAFGQVKQEKWIAKNLDKIPVRVAMGVGGAFDYLSDSVIRAPGFIRAIGLEWLFRLILQPWRIKRQIKLLNFITLLLFKT
ncbi:MAG: WecB/TagA/CpsF family glycosyltransferase [Microgenomates group bacterium]|jgi:N-acetylglucosaminyldiphosphoundecaprenol N-acetyl-beta-D-mannosaminyltransferase